MNGVERNMLTERRRIRVWFGDTSISDYVAAPDLAARHEKAMRRRFARLRVTNDAIPPLLDRMALNTSVGGSAGEGGA